MPAAAKIAAGQTLAASAGGRVDALAPVLALRVQAGDLLERLAGLLAETR